MKTEKCAILFSGGTDSMCTAAVLAEQYHELHLLTYYDRSNSSNVPIENVKKLKTKYPNTVFIHKVISTEDIVRHLSSHDYIRYLFRYGFLVLSNCLYSSLSWHIRTLIYCKKNRITNIADGLTREMMYLPGHMDLFIYEIRSMYLDYDLNYSNTVRDWDTPEEQTIFDRFIVDQHGFLFPSEEDEKNKKRSTGKYLFEKGIFPHPNIKGSSYDQRMQHDCYPFVFYKIIVFWIYLQFFNLPKLEKKLSQLTRDKIIDYKDHIERELGSHEIEADII